MLEIITRAVNAEAAVYAVQAGADAIYISTEDYAPRAGSPSFASDELALALRYCRVRGCRVYVELDLLASEREVDSALTLAVRACEMGADALIVHDLGLARLLRRMLPDTALFAGQRLNLHSVAGAMAAAEMGFSRVILAPELSVDEIARISARLPVPVMLFGHGSACISQRGQCWLSALAGTGRDSCGRCARPCHGEMSMGMFSPAQPLAQKDLCLADRIGQVEAAGVRALLLELAEPLHPELAACVTELYVLAAHEGRAPLPAEIERLQRQLYPGGLTRGWIDGAAGEEMFGLPQSFGRDGQTLLTQTRREYAGRELRRVPVEFFAMGKPNALALAVQDAQGHRVITQIDGCRDPIGEGMAAEALEDRLCRTGGTPYNFTGLKAARLEHILVTDEQLDEAKVSMLSALTEQRARLTPCRVHPAPSAPRAKRRNEAPVLTMQVQHAGQLTPELAALSPALVYVPIEELAAHFDAAAPFLEAGSRVAAVLPRAITDGELGEVARLLRKLRSLGIDEVLLGNLGHIAPARMAECRVHGDFGLNLTNSSAMALMDSASLETVTASLELSLAELAEMPKPVDTELIVYGRVPVMLTDHCLIRQAAGGRCDCKKSSSLSDRFGGVYPVLPAFGCRNEILSRGKLYLGDRRSDWEHIDLWGVRLIFTTESAHECLAVARAVAGETDYIPNNITRGLYYKGA